jgi:predicted transcriptional regulator
MRGNKTVSMRRSREDIIVGILDAIDHKINRISSIMRNVNLNVISAKKYLDYLMKSKLVEEKDGEYILTDKGRRVLELLREKTKIEIELAMLLNEIADLMR